jgi:hypothetical protein
MLSSYSHVLMEAKGCALDEGAARQRAVEREAPKGSRAARSRPRWLQFGKTAQGCGTAGVDADNSK